MGANLARNIASRGFPVGGYDLDAAKTQGIRLGASSGSGTGSADCARPPDGRARAAAPRVDDGAEGRRRQRHRALRPHLEREDILIDGGNSFFRDTDRRADDLASAGFRFVGMGVSGGEEGALLGPSMMPGGPREAWEALAPILRAMAAKAEDGDPCVSYMGPRGAGHYVKMVHNGIEYGDMQLIAEVYDVLTRAAGMSAREIADTFAKWNEGELRSYLVEITARVLERVDSETGKPLVDLILDEAQQKGTGKWMSQNAFDVGAPIPTVNAAVEARLLSALKSERVVASKVLAGPMGSVASHVVSGFSRTDLGLSRTDLINATREALYAAKITSYAQGMALLRQASQEYKYDIDLAEVAKIWRAGCIIRAALLSDIRAAFSRNPALVNLMLDDRFSNALASGQQALRDVVQAAVSAGIPVPALSSSLAYYDSYRSARLPANLTQGQRDFFGAHTYRRVDRDGVFHTDWTPE